jgi:hypothetical protein
MDKMSSKIAEKVIKALMEKITEPMPHKILKLNN